LFFYGCSFSNALFAAAWPPIQRLVLLADGSEGGPERGGEFREAIDRHKSIELLLGESGHDDGPSHIRNYDREKGNYLSNTRIWVKNQSLY
jgi:hypothetical protein